jgi:hypothetical protein
VIGDLGASPLVAGVEDDVLLQARGGGRAARATRAVGASAE